MKHCILKSNGFLNIIIYSIKMYTLFIFETVSELKSQKNETQEFKC